MPAGTIPDGDQQVMALHAESLKVTKRVRRKLVQVRRTTQVRNATVAETLAHDTVVVERVAINRVVDAIPPVRQEGDVTIMPVVEEIVVVERRLVLKEEVHLRRVRSLESYVQNVTLREQHVTVTRTDLDL